MSITDRMVQANVCLATAQQVAACNGTSRTGTRYGVTLHDLAKRLGNPHEAAPVEDRYDYKKDLVDGAGKVSAIWYVSTPRGLVEIRDYWWNKRDVMSLGSVDCRAVIWVHRWMDLHNLGRKSNEQDQDN